jgi:L-alanine-DL-glutamate epimerase-like enolase superfamily enzyme
MKTATERLALTLADAFTISRESMTETANVLVRIEDDEGTTGVGGAAPSRYYGETAATVEAVLPDLLGIVEDQADPHALQRLERALAEAVGDNPAAKAAVSIALYDLVAKRVDLPLYRYWGLDPDRAPTTSFTIGLADPDRMREKAGDAVNSGFDVLKVKLGTAPERDRTRIAAIREAAPDATIRVDANEGWTPRQAVTMSDALADHGVEFLEQPVAATDRVGQQFVFEHSAVPIAADESCVTASDVPTVAHRADVAVVKLMKCGGLGPAIELIDAAHAHDLEVMLGCMIESNASIAAAAHLSPLVEYADLDGSLLLAADPYAGVPMPEGRIDLDAVDRPGTGAVRT